MSRNLTLVIHALHGGGAERVAATMANRWTRQGDRVTLITLDTVDSDVYRVDGLVERVGLGLMRISANSIHAGWNNAQRIRALRQAMRTAASDCVVSVTDRMNVMVLLASRGLDSPVVIAEHSDPRHQPMGEIWEHLRKWTYPRCTAAVALTQSVAEHLRTLVGQRPVYVIPNGIRAPSVTVADIPDRDEHTIVAMGRLSPEKGFDLLIDAFVRLAPRHPDWRLKIAGEGPERSALQQQIDERGLGQQVAAGRLGGRSRPIPVAQCDVRHVVALRGLSRVPAGSHVLWSAGDQFRLRQRPARDHPTRSGRFAGPGRRWRGTCARDRASDVRHGHPPPVRRTSAKWSSVSAWRSSCSAGTTSWTRA